MGSTAGWKFKCVAYATCAVLVFLLFISPVRGVGSNDLKPSDAESADAQRSSNSITTNEREINELKRQLAEQQKQIEELRTILENQAKLMGDGRAPVAKPQPATSMASGTNGNVAGVAPMSSFSSSDPGIKLPASATPTPSTTVASQAGATSDLPPILKHFKPIGTFYISYQAGMQDSGVNQTRSFNAFLLKRGYFGADVDITPYFTARWVGDVTLDSFGDVKVRNKYLYGKFHAKGNNVLTAPYMEFGLSHMPWLDFEEAINGFRMQDTMFLERNSIFNSADLGVLVGADIGGSLSSDYKSRVNSHYAGRYGSWQLGLYNGGGYHAAEQNNNKVLEARLSIRPVPSSVPGLQLTAFGLVGKGNKPAANGLESPDWKSSVGMISYESQYFTFTGQGYLGIGNQGGTALEPNGTSAHQKGFSVFASVHIPLFDSKQKLSLLGRLDEFNSNTRIYNDLQRLYIAGIAWHFYKDNIWLIDYQRTQHSLDSLAGEDRLQVTLQTIF